MKIRPAALVDLVRRPDWLTGDRAWTYCWMLAVVTTIQAIHLIVSIVSTALADPHWRPVTTDFDAFWSGAVLAAEGQPASAYDHAIMRVAQTIGAQPVAGQFLPYMNPPIFLLLCLPLGFLPYLPAMAAFVLGSYATMVAVLKRLLPGWPLLCVAALPVAMLNGTEGQNGSISATAFAAGMLLVDRRPLLAGAYLGVLSFKPHLALGVPVALCAARRWATLAGFAASVAGLALLSWLVLGTDTWIGFFGSTRTMHAVLEQSLTWPKMQSVYAAVRILHGQVSLALALQAVTALLALTMLAQSARRRNGGGPEVAAAVAASLLCTPYLLDYDLACLAVPMAWLAASGSVGGWLPWEKSLLAALYVYPLEARNMNLCLGLPVAPLLLFALLGMILVRSRTVSASGEWSPAYERDCLAETV